MLSKKTRDKVMSDAISISQILQLEIHPRRPF